MAPLLRAAPKDSHDLNWFLCGSRCVKNHWESTSPGSYRTQDKHMKDVYSLHTVLNRRSGTLLPLGDIRPCSGRLWLSRWGAPGIEGLGSGMLLRSPSAWHAPPRVTCPNVSSAGMKGVTLFCLALRSKGTPSSLLQSQIYVTTTEGKTAA